MSLGLRLERPLVLFDLEGTGPDPKTARIIQIAMKIFEPNGTYEVHYTYIDPTVPIPKVRFFLDHGLTDELIEKGCARCGRTAEEHPSPEACEKWRRIPKFEEVAQPLFRRLQGVDFAGYNLKRYDLPLIREEFARLNLTLDYSKANVICGFRLWQVLEPRTLTDAVEKYGEGEKLDNAHNALADVLGTEIALRGMLRQPNVPQNVDELGHLLFPRDPNQIDEAGKFKFIDGVACFNFGKHKGKPMKTDIGYLKWMLKPESEFNRETKSIVQKAVDGAFPVYEPPEDESADDPADSPVI